MPPRRDRRLGIKHVSPRRQENRRQRRQVDLVWQDYVRLHPRGSDRHPDARNGVRFDAFTIWIAEENEDSVPDVLVDGSTNWRAILDISVR
jgi:hypothetical protein